jgi:hypothetical protein
LRKTFRPSRHGELLATDPVPPELADFGERYCEAGSRACRVLFARDAHCSGMPGKGEQWRPLTLPEIAQRLSVSARRLVGTTPAARRFPAVLPFGGFAVTSDAVDAIREDKVVAGFAIDGVKRAVADIDQVVEL